MKRTVRKALGLPRHKDSNRLSRSHQKGGIIATKSALIPVGDVNETDWIHKRFYDDAFTSSFVT